MPEFKFYLDKKVTIWNREFYTVTAETHEDATKLIKESFSNSTLNADVEGPIQFSEQHVQFETEEPLTVEENQGSSTEELYTDSGDILIDNGK